MSASPAPPPAAVQPAFERFERGDFKGATDDLKAILASKPAPDVDQAARDVLLRMAPDPWALRFGLGALVLLILLCIIYLM